LARFEKREACWGLFGGEENLLGEKKTRFGVPVEKKTNLKFNKQIKNR